jgi:hypothetical protein
MPTSGFQLIDSDIALLNHAFQLRVATLELLAQLAGRSYKNTHKRVKKLAEQKYLALLTKRPEKHLYAIGPAAMPELIGRGYAPQDLAEKRLRNYELQPLGMKTLPPRRGDSCANDLAHAARPDRARALA